jgi:histidine triad (HIT) family protein
MPRPRRDCPFCEIITGDGPATVIYRDELVIAFLDINPVTTGHLLVVSLDHAPGLADLDAATGSRMFAVAREMARALRSSSVRCDGVNLFYADGEVAAQEVFHAHLHVIPRFEGDGFSIQANRREYPTRDQLEATGGKIRSAIAGPSSSG